MILFNSGMQKEKIALAGLVIIIVVALFGYLAISEGLFDNLFTDESVDTIEIGDCVDVNYIGRYASNGTIFDTSYLNVENKSGGTPLNIFVTFDSDASTPEGYETYSSGMIEGFMEGLPGLKEGEFATIGPIAPEKAYGVLPVIGDVLEISDDSFEQDFYLEFIDIIEDSPVPEEYLYYYGDVQTNDTLYVMKDQSHYIGEKMTLYPSWENASVVTKINDTKVWIETTPTENKTSNFTWQEYDASGQLVTYWQDASSITVNETYILVTHSPEINQTYTGPDPVYGAYGYTSDFTVVSLSDDKINLSYTGLDGNITYTEMDRTVSIEVNQTQDLLFEFPELILNQLISFFKTIDPTIPYSLAELAGETLTFELEIVEVYKTSQES